MITYALLLSTSSYSTASIVHCALYKTTETENDTSIFFHVFHIGRYFYFSEIAYTVYVHNLLLLQLKFNKHSLVHYK